MRFSKAFNRPMQSSLADTKKALLGLDYKSIEMYMRNYWVIKIRNQYMAEITLEEAWALCPEAMVAWDRDHSDITIGQISTWDEIHWSSWGKITIYRTKDGGGCLDYHPDVDRWYDWETVPMSLHKWKAQFGVMVKDQGVGIYNVPQP